MNVVRVLIARGRGSILVPEVALMWYHELIKILVIAGILVCQILCRKSVNNSSCTESGLFLLQSVFMIVKFL